MKLKQIASLCKDSGRIILYDRTDSDGVVSQWIGDGCGTTRWKVCPIWRWIISSTYLS